MSTHTTYIPALARRVAAEKKKKDPHQEFELLLCFLSPQLWRIYFFFSFSSRLALSPVVQSKPWNSCPRRLTIRHRQSAANDWSHLPHTDRGESNVRATLPNKKTESRGGVGVGGRTIEQDGRDNFFRINGGEKKRKKNGGCEMGCVWPSKREQHDARK